MSTLKTITWCTAEIEVSDQSITHLLATEGVTHIACEARYVGDSVVLSCRISVGSQTHPMVVIIPPHEEFPDKHNKKILDIFSVIGVGVISSLVFGPDSDYEYWDSIVSDYREGLAISEIIINEIAEFTEDRDTILSLLSGD